jgi:hypothetical protein
MAHCASEACTRWRPGVLTGLSGVTIGDRWFCSRACVERMARQLLDEPETPRAVSTPRHARHLRIGLLLRHQHVLSADQLHRALEEQQKSGLRLGAQARALFGIEPSLVLKALAAQAGTRYLTAIDPATVRDAPGGLSVETARALGLIPFSHPDKQGHVRVASTAPLRWDAVNALRRLAGWTPEPYLVEDSTWNELLEHYGSDLRTRPGEPQRDAAVVLTGSREDAAAQIATIAISGRRARVSEARWDPYVWVRVEGGAAVRDVLFARPATQEETSWQAANTSH